MSTAGAFSPASSAAALRLLGGRSPADFLARYWQRRALLVRGALTDLAAVTSFTNRKRLAELASRDDVESRLVTRTGRNYTLAPGPFRPADLRRLPPRNWTLLVSGVNLEDRDADRLLRRFAFLPYARLDDLMVSYAAPGGGVGPHYDSYDVFLLQAAGRRRWRYGRQRDLALRGGAPLRLLRRFEPSRSDTLAPGDLLYLPPDYAHDGVAIDACVTCSIGFRAPLFQELAEAFLDHLRDRVTIAGRYADPGLAPSSRPALIDSAMQRQVASALATLRIDHREALRFLGCHLSEPKPLVHFTRPAGMPFRKFVLRATRSGVALDRRTQILYDRDRIYVNGEAMPYPPSDAASLRRLADDRALPARRCARLGRPMLSLLHAWYQNGYLEASP